MATPLPSGQDQGVAQAAEQALAFHRRGMLAEAETCYAAILQAVPDHFDALHLLGVLRQQQGNSAEAARLIGAALRMNPCSVDALCSFGAVLHALNRHDEALAACDKALAIKPDHVEALCRRGATLLALRRVEEALAAFDRALAVDPDLPAALNHRGNALVRLDRLEEAVAAFDRALAVKPDQIEALIGRGNTLMLLDRCEEALAAFDRIIEIRSDHAMALGNGGLALVELGRYEEALDRFGRTLALTPDNVLTLDAYGNTLMLLDRCEEALAAFDRVIEIRPDNAMALGNGGLALVELGRYEEALDRFGKALDLTPDNVLTLDAYGNTLLLLNRHADALAAFDTALELAPDRPDLLKHRADALRELRRHDEAVQTYDRVLAAVPDDAETLFYRGKSLWALGRLEQAIVSYERASALEDTRALGELVFCLLAIADWARADQLASALRKSIAKENFVHSFATVGIGLGPLDQLKAARSLIRDVVAGAPKPFIHSTAVDADKLRIAYLSSDFRHHAVGVAAAELFERHDRTRFEIIGVSFGPDDKTGTRARIVAAFDRFHDVASHTDRDIARLLNDLQVHIAVDLNGLTEGYRPGVLACRPAPIQINYLGYPGTTGAEYIDYVIADETVLPFAEQPFFTEKIVHLPDCYHVNDATRRISSYVAPRSDLGPPDRGMVFCCFNQPFKIAAPIFDVWMRLLTRVPASVLWLSELNDPAQANLRRHAAARGVDPDRLIFAPRMDSSEDHLARHHAADLFLDTLPYNAHSTAIDALWAGLPVVTCAGIFFPGRVAASLLKAANLPELVTRSLADYEALAFRLATDPALLSSMRRKLADSRATCALFDSDRFRRHLEAAYATMWDIHRRGESPRSFRVEPSA